MCMQVVYPYQLRRVLQWMTVRGYSPARDPPVDLPEDLLEPWRQGWCVGPCLGPFVCLPALFCCAYLHAGGLRARRHDGLGGPTDARVVQAKNLPFLGGNGGGRGHRGRVVLVLQGVCWKTPQCCERRFCLRTPHERLHPFQMPVFIQPIMHPLLACICISIQLRTRSCMKLCFVSKGCALGISWPKLSAPFESSGAPARCERSRGQFRQQRVRQEHRARGGW